MVTLARILIALMTCPGLGAAIGRDVSARLAAWEPDVGVATRIAPFDGLVLGGLLGLAFALLTIICATARGEQVRRRIADPVLIALGGAAVLELLVRRWHAGYEAAATVRGVSAIVWTLGLIFILLASRCRPEAGEGEGVHRAEEGTVQVERDTPGEASRFEEETHDV